MHRHKTCGGTYRFLVLLTVLILPSILFSQETMIPGKVIVGFYDGSSPEATARRVGAKVVRSIQSMNVHLLSFSESNSIDDMVTNLSSQPGVRFVQPDYVMSLPETGQISQEFPDGNRPVYVRGVSPETYYKQPGVYNIGVDSANIIATGTDVLVAVIDNGFDFDHPLFKQAYISSGYDYIDFDNDASAEPGTLQSHGTFVAGIVVRVAPDCKLLPLRAFNEEGVGNCFAIAQAISKAIDDDANVINMSFSMYQSNPLIEHAITEAVRAGIALVAAVGNDSCDITSYPGAYQYVLAVSAINDADVLASFSNYGDYIDICAPGVDIYSALSGEYEWGTWSGTSFAAPFVSAACALVLDLKPAWKSRKVWNHIKTTANTDLEWGTVPLNDPQYGDGCIDVYEAVLSIIKGDVNDDGEVNFLDIDFLNRFVNMAGPAPLPIRAVGDVDGSGLVDTADVRILIEEVYKKGE
ncbi:MAG: S8 family serine peptidase [candidate division Zixibacteria bacterium]|nr:S8 family serine peptidase [candidate division Zixibacteria bacterium]